MRLIRNGLKDFADACYSWYTYLRERPFWHNLDIVYEVGV
jgi:hypothetical protein